MHHPIHKILIANRGEIAVRIARTCRAMGIATVAVFSDADADAEHVGAADEAVRIGAAAAAESYLAIDKILAAAELTGAQAIHPGFGFLAENAGFAAACAERGVIFIGPSAETIRLLGSKRESKRVVEAAGVPVIPGYSGADQDPENLAARARDIGFPVLIKASAGGGGKGMRVVRESAGLAEAIAAARREAKSAFADDTLLIETYIDRPRHIEFQIIGDGHGQLFHLFERECSIQRRHQKIIEETPSPALDDDKRREMARAALAVGRAVGYENAGTVEFILAPDGRFFFLEVNTRLQVEHPITEAITGVDLVREQIRVARGERLALDQVEMRGAAIECRLYAEDGDDGFLPMTGTVLDWHVPERVAGALGLRVDSGVAVGREVGIHYDPMLAKLIVHGPTRTEAVHKMMAALRALSVQGLITNREFLLRVLGHPGFMAGATHTHFLQDHAADLARSAVDESVLQLGALAAALSSHEDRRQARRVLPHLEPGFRNNRGALVQRVRYRVERDGRVLDVCYHNLGHNLGARGFEIALAVGADRGAAEPEAAEVATEPASESVFLVSCAIQGAAREVIIERENGLRQRARIVSAQRPSGDLVHHVHTSSGDIVLVEEPRFPTLARAAVAGGCIAPMPGRIVKLAVAVGQEVRPGQTLVVLEAMKMEHAVKATSPGVVSEVRVAEGDQVDSDELLVVVTDTPAPE